LSRVETPFILSPHTHTNTMKILAFSLSFAMALALSDAFSSLHQRPFSVQSRVQSDRASSSSFALFSTTKEKSAPDSSTNTDDEAGTNDKGLLKRDRYVATNRFAVRPGKEAKFEQRWATRKSRLAELEGFRYFHLMRRVQLLPQQQDDDASASTPTSYYYDGGDDKESRQGNYVSFTIWQRKSDFSAWRKGDAFKEAHGGTSIGAFLSTSECEMTCLSIPRKSSNIDFL
jgi:heme-degrading monooxygenase HmoA